MKKSILPCTLILTLAASAGAQVGSEGFEAGNPDGWEMWWSNYTSVISTGGNPGAFLQLDNVTSGPSNCHYVPIFPAASGTGFLHSGNWRAAGVNSVTIDLDVQQGLYGGDVILELISDPGTPGVTSDDCIISLALNAVGPAGPGWNTYTFDVPATQLTMPPAWVIDSMSPCSTGPANDAWNEVLEDVDRIRVTYDGIPPAFCNFTNWIIGADNLTVTTAGAGPLGTIYCAANVNSTGAAATMSAAGSAVAADNLITLTCSSMPTNSFAFMITGQTQGFVPNPGGSSGNLCLGGSIGRYVGPGQVQNSGGLGEVSLGLDLTQHPTPTGFVAVQPGETWNFSTWFRDSSPAGPTSNFSDGYSILFF